MKTLVALSLLLISGLAVGDSNLHTEDLTYTANGRTFKGYLAYDKTREAKRPGVLVVHEWWGLNDYARKRARMLADQGFTALALDMYGEGKQARHPDEAGAFARQVQQHLDIANARFTAALDLLRQQSTTDTQHIAAIGYCFGGGIVLEMARAGVDLDGVVSFHGTLATPKPAEPGKIKADILVLQGREDQFVPPEQLAKFRQEMEKAGADFEIITYADAKHSFTNPQADEYAKRFGVPLAYNAKADRASWADMLLFFNEIFD